MSRRALVGHVLDDETPEDVVDEAGGDAQVGVVGHARGLEAHVGERLDERLERHAVLQAHGSREIANASMIPASVEPCFATLRNTSPGRPSSYSPTVAYPWQSATRNENVFELRVRGSFWRTGSCTMTCSTMRSTTCAGSSSASASGEPVSPPFFWVASGCATLQLSR